MKSDLPYIEYLNGVTSGKIVTNDYVRLAVERHLTDLTRQGAPDFPYRFDERQGQRFITFAQNCYHWKGTEAGKPIRLELHQQFYFMLLFGWLRMDGGRRFRSSYKEIARKNGKTTECAIKSMGHVLLDNEPGAQVYIAATKEEQARIGFRDVQEIIRRSPGLGDIFKVYVKSVTKGASFIKPLGSDSDTQDGFDPSYGIIDEYHAHPTSGMLNVLESGMVARKSPLIDIITTAGFNRNFPCYTEVRKTSIDILRGIKKDDTHLALIYTLDDGDDWQDETVWIKSNPNLGVSVRLDSLRERMVKAKNEGGSKEVDFKTKNLNVWTDAERTWIPDDVYMKGAKDQTYHGAPSDLHRFAGRKCKTGLDLASVRDLCAWCLAFKEGDRYRVIWFYFLPEETIKERSSKGLPYGQWVREGYIIPTPGDVVDYDYIRAKINEVSKIVKIESIEYDRWNSSQLIINLTADGFTCNPFGQGMASMSTPTKELEKLIYSGWVDHGGNPVARWNFSNVMIRTDPAGNIKIDKEKSGEKVDGAVALVMAIGGHLTPSKVTESPYMTRGVRTL